MMGFDSAIDATISPTVNMPPGMLRPMMGLQAYLTLAAVLFSIGLFGVLTRRNTIGILLGIELMLNAVNINLVAFARFYASVAGMVFTVFTICITVAEVALGLALVILIFRVRRTVIADHLDLLRG
jgi:NADH-quinone oxidoreductase subunit K